MFPRKLVNVMTQYLNVPCQERELNIGLVGSPETAKYALASCFLEGDWQHGQGSRTVRLDGREYRLHLWDVTPALTPRGSRHESDVQEGGRPSEGAWTYPPHRAPFSDYIDHMDALLMIYSVHHMDTFTAARGHCLWRRHIAPGTSMVIVGVICNTSHTSGPCSHPRAVPYETAGDVGRQVGVPVVETRPETGTNIEQVFLLALVQALRARAVSEEKACPGSDQQAYMGCTVS